MIFREATIEDQDIIRKIIRYAFDNKSNEYLPPDTKEPPKISYKIKDYVSEENGNITALIGVIDFLQNIRGSFVKSAGLSAVACRPEYRRKGHITQLFTFIFSKMYKEGYIVSCLYPFDYQFYETLGYGQADQLYAYTLKTSDIIQRPTPNRIIQEDFDPNFPRCHPIYDKLSNQISGLVKRPPYVWKNLYSWYWQQKGYQFICQDLEGNDVGYIILRFEKKVSDPEETEKIVVSELVYNDPETKQALLNFLANHDSQSEYVQLAPYEQNYLPYLKSPRMKKNETIANSMIRIINFQALMTELKFPPELDTKITLEIKDPTTQCPWNNQIIELRIQNGTITLTSSKNSPDIRLGIKELSQIVIGFHAPQELAEIGKIQGSDKAIMSFAEIFPKKVTALRDYF